MSMEKKTAASRTAASTRKKEAAYSKTEASTGKKKAIGTEAAAPAGVKKKQKAGESRTEAHPKTPLNLRNGPGYEYGIIRVLLAEENLVLTGTEENGFVSVLVQNEADAAEAGWVCEAFIEVGERD